MLSALCLSCPGADSILEGRGLPAAGFLVPAEIRGSQAMRRPSNILTGDGGGQWSGCVCVNTSSQNTHMCKETCSQKHTHAGCMCVFSPLHRCTWTHITTHSLPSGVWVTSIELHGEKERTEGKSRLFKDDTGGIVCCRPLPLQIQHSYRYFPKQTWSFKIDFLPSRQPVVSVYLITSENQLVESWNLPKIHDPIHDPSRKTFHCLYFLAKLDYCHEVWSDMWHPVPKIFAFTKYYYYWSY